ncbi:MAG: type II and III secretion system protein family protein [Thermodesulfobacteriota bacterium]|nr:type II and III secretion system protein family protein [Thermodesulfobacteriota bacterium]
MIPNYRIICLFFMVVLFVPVGICASEKGKTINLSVGESTVRGCGGNTWLVSIGDPTIADVKLKKAGKRMYVLITAKDVGSTNIVICKGKGNDCTNAFKLKVWKCIDPCKLMKKRLKEILPDEPIEVVGAGDSVILSGVVSSTTNISIAMDLAEAVVMPRRGDAGKSGISVGGKGGGSEKGEWWNEREQMATVGKVVNLMQVGGVQQVMLEVRVAEMGRKLMKRLGVNFSYFSGEDFAFGMLKNLINIDELPTIGVSSPINALFRFQHGNASWTGFIDALKTEGIIKILAKPTLITLSGENAEFLAGGEFPVPVPGDWDEVKIEWKKYGVELQFTPRVLSNNKISLKVMPAVSELDYEHAVEFWGFVIPALTTRYASTTIELDDGQSFAIAGLLNEKVYEDVAKYPILGDIPVLGALFRSSEFRKHESELVIIVTPHLVKPLDMAKQTLPTDAYVEPNDFEFYLLGLKEGVQKREKRSSVLFRDEGLEGNFGHIAP